MRPRWRSPVRALALLWLVGTNWRRSELQAQGAPSPLTFGVGTWQLTLGGFFKLSVNHDFDANSSPDLFDPRSIPVDGTRGTNTRITARETRLSLGLKGPAGRRNLEFLLEGDFFGPGTGTGNTFRLRHAYARYGALLAGQTWTTFMDELNIPPTIDFEHALATPLVRQGLVRVTTAVSPGGELAFALEESDPVVLNPTAIPGAVEKAWPDLTTRYRLTGRRGHIQLSGFLGQTRFRNTAGDPREVTIGGVLLSARLQLFEADAASLELVYGPGVGRYRGDASASLDSTGHLRTVDLAGLTIGYQHRWSERWSSHVVVSPVRVVGDAGPPTADDGFDYLAANLLYWFIDKRAWIGGEYLYGRRRLVNGTRATGHRIQLAVRFNIMQ